MAGACRFMARGAGLMTLVTSLAASKDWPTRRRSRDSSTTRHSRIHSAVALRDRATDTVRLPAGRAMRSRG